MLAVIFRAEMVDHLDEKYVLTAKQMRKLATEKYGCLGFESVYQDGKEIAISYWPDKDSIQRWRADPEHQLAQQAGRTHWYRSYRIQIVEVLREYEGSCR